MKLDRLKDDGTRKTMKHVDGLEGLEDGLMVLQCRCHTCAPFLD